MITNPFWLARFEVSGLTQKQAADLCGVTVRQVRRWESGQARVPVAALKLVRIVGGGELAELCGTWAGWRLVDGKLITPEGTGYRPGEIRALPLQFALLAAYKNNRLQAARSALSQPQKTGDADDGNNGRQGFQIPATGI